ncbi:GlsB/YeaQ/YmgE family stress response membrane protein [Bosea rubneri]|uniref:GlsB/YeaQ/YmgE family stress response membrane protein n=1 Tax=Bosea rubneri TaxID=3075434 RepID=A0ABU3S9G7_9HYPH|nr:GlsB/YeaQ/YmgE family stress response membrane protein [Bosea sp. ZW T0_25]MDU0341428.1 GlsB/YeaQ/YmgE family stress response membrane protein [Bosea sp. ZW T0_25]
MDMRAILVAIVIGLVAGWLASIVVGGGGLVRYIITGLIGAFVGSFLLGALGINLGIGNPLISQIVTATIGAIVVVLLARLIA